MCSEDCDINWSTAEFIMAIGGLFVLLCFLTILIYLGALIFVFVEIFLLKSCILYSVTACELFSGKWMLIVLGTIDANMYLHK